MAKHLKPITSELLEDDMLLVLSFPTTGDEIEAYSLLIKRSNPISKDYTEMLEIPSGGTVDTDKLGENGHADQVADPGDNVFRIVEEKDKKRIYHFGQLWEPDDLKIWWENPADQLIQGFTRTTAVSVGDDEGYIWSDHTKYGPKMPSTEMETFSLPGVTPFIGFQNSSTRTQKPVGYFYGKAYKVEVINAVDMDKAKDIALGIGYKRTLKSFGPLGAYSISLPEEWGDPVELSPEELVNAIRR